MKVCAPNTSSTTPIVVEMSVTIHRSERHVCISGIVLPLSKIFLLDFGTVPTISAVCFMFYFISAKLT